MRLTVAEAEGRLPDLVNLALSGVEVVLLQEGGAATQLVPIARTPLSAEERKKVFEKIRQRAKDDPPTFDTNAARSQDFLYDEYGLPK